MSTRRDRVIEAVLAATLVSVIVGACLAAGDYVFFAGGARLLERLAVLPVGWGGSHAQILRVVAAAVALLGAGVIAALVYRSASDALRGERPGPGGEIAC